MDRLIELYRREIKRITDIVASGSCQDMIQYKSLIATISALEWAIETAHQVDGFDGEEDDF